jgi:hypothetical protein
MTMLHPDVVDEVDASAPVIEAEIAAAIVNRAQAVVQRRIAQLVEDSDTAEADRLRATAAKPLFALLRSIDDRNEAHVQAIIAAWGPRVMDAAALWDALGPPAGLRADG